MGKYIRKAKTAGEVAVMDISQASLGVRTRAKTLALQRLKKSSTSPAQEHGSYLQLRSRRLEKPTPPVLVHHHDSKRQKQNQQKQEEGSKKDDDDDDKCGQNRSPNSISRVRVSCHGSNSENKKEGEFGSQDIEVSFGENILDFEARERGTRESTPCSLIRDSESIRTPGSTTKPTSSAEINQRVQNSTRTNIPTSNEMDEFFTRAEVDQRRQFIEKYNFDPVKDKPLTGRYQWEKVDP